MALNKFFAKLIPKDKAEPSIKERLVAKEKAKRK
jgi:hypothetical protein